MKRELGVGFLAAVILHAAVLFGLRLETPAHPLALSEEPSPVDVSLVAAPPEPAPAAEAPTPSEPAATPEPVPTPEPRPTPDMPTPPAVAEPTPDEDAIPAQKSTPAPVRPKPATHRPEQRPSKPATPHSAGGSAAALAGAASHGAASGRLSSHARYMSNPRPDYPAEARRERQEGVVLVSVEVGADGRAAGVSLGRSSGFPLLDQAALEAVRRWMFAPAEEAGVPVSSRVEVPVRFSLAR